MIHRTRWLKVGRNIAVHLHYKPGQSWYVLSVNDYSIVLWPLQTWVLTRSTGEHTLVQVRYEGASWVIERAARVIPGRRITFSPVKLAA